MSVHTTDNEPSLFDPKPDVDAAKEPEPPVALVEASDAEEPEPESASSEGEPSAEAEEDSPKNDRKRLSEQLEALRRKEAELLRALAITDHPDLADAIRTI